MTSRTDRPSIVGPESPQQPYPLFSDTVVVAGFGRGSSDLGIPTANIPPDSYEPVLKATTGYEASDTGIYYGYARVDVGNAKALSACEERNKEYLKDRGGSNGSIVNPQGRDIDFTFGASLSDKDAGVVYPMVMSVGWNPFYGNSSRSAEIYIMHKFGGPFYGARIRYVVLGYIRPELDYVSVEALIADINTDVQVAERSLARKEYSKYKDDAFFR
ncbi:uncharacterized protein SAPINGB_P002299 [Magnusiomyces paraingens]|uniref:Riboflavin kinase n=1 Tax=Magnusiomyces paraingens TaxID=2606893 RepID=A0A5E8BDH8_9ASCO|nr:uncharacterized protein SAPINGB_P002299 [Saprochaete ingens]VVT49498.1 unnamed protein product [Saprochaete ingens]